MDMLISWVIGIIPQDIYYKIVLYFKYTLFYLQIIPQ